MSTDVTASPSTTAPARFQEERPTNLGSQFFKLLTTTDHKLIGMMYMGMAFAFFAFGGGVLCVIASPYLFVLFILVRARLCSFVPLRQ